MNSCLALNRRKIMKSLFTPVRFCTCLQIQQDNHQYWWECTCHILKVHTWINDNLYHRFLKWHLKCKNILECELVALPKCQKCKKVIAWNRDCSMDQYVSWNLPSNELTLDAIWGKYEEYCKPQSNKVQARFDLLTGFCQGNHSVDEWHNAIQAQVNLARYPPETAKILHRDIWFFLKDEDFVSRTISDGSIDLDKFPVSRVCQLAKKLESSNHHETY